MKRFYRYVAFAVMAVLLTGLLFACVNDVEAEDELTLPAETTIATTIATTTTTQPVQPIDSNNPLVGAWVTQEGGGSVFAQREHRNWAMLEFFADNTGHWEDGYNGGEFTWQVVGGKVLYITGSPVEGVYNMEYNGNEMRLDGILFTRTMIY